LTLLSVVILSWNTKDLLEACLGSIFSKEWNLDIEVIVVDNASEDGSSQMAATKFPEVMLIQNKKNEGYARGNNIGIRSCKGDHILLLNSDTEVRDGSFDKMVLFLEDNPEYGACGGQLINPDGSLQTACMRFPTLSVTMFYDTFIEKLFPNNNVVKKYFMKDFDHDSSIDVDQPPGACFMVTREVVEKVGLLDEDLWLFYNDVDYCKRIWDEGYKIRFVKGACVMHHIGGSTSKYGDFSLELHRNRVRYFRKHFGLRGVIATKLAAIVKGAEEIIRCLRAGCKFGSPEVRRVREIVREVLRT